MNAFSGTQDAFSGFSDTKSLIIDSQLGDLTIDHPELKEDLDRVRQQFAMLDAEDRGWLALMGGSPEEDTGISLDTLKDVARRLREEVAGSALPKRANELRYSYTFGKSFIIPDVHTDSTLSKRGRKSVLQTFYDDPENQQYLFGEEAQFTMHSASSTDGMYLFLGDNATKRGRPVPITQITAIYTNPDFPDDIWGYKREWSSYNADGKATPEKKWYLTDRFPDNKKKPTTLNKVAVDTTKTIIDLRFNTQSGWTLGVPDLMAGQIWNKKYLQMIQDGEQVSHTLAVLSAKVRVNSQAGAKSVGAQVKRAGQKAGGTVPYGKDNEVDVFSTAGKTYDFGGLRIFAAFYASSVGVPLTDLTADPSAAGASYGSASALLPSARRTIEARRALWASWYSRVFKWATGKEISVAPESIEETDIYRRAQMATLAWNTGLFHEDEIRPVFTKLSGVTPLHVKAPDGVLLPNNQDSWERSDIDPSKQGDTGATSSPGQGQSNGTGGSDGSVKSDLRDDTVSAESILRAMNRDELLDTLQEMSRILESEK